MPRIRTIKPEFWADEKLSVCDPLTRLVFLGLISMADDAGRLVDNVKQIDGFLFPETDDTAREALDTLAKMSRITRYTSESGQKLIQINGWAKHQKVDKPSRHVLPPPPDTPISSTAVGEDSRDIPGNPRDSVANNSGNTRAPYLGSRIMDRDDGKDTKANAFGDEPRENAKPAADPIPATIAPLVRKYLWLTGRKSNTPPPEILRATPDWSMGRELDIAKRLINQGEATLDELAGVIPIARKTLGFRADEKLTLRILRRDGRRDQLAECLAVYRDQQRRAGNGPQSAADLLNLKVAGR